MKRIGWGGERGVGRFSMAESAMPWQEALHMDYQNRLGNSTVSWMGLSDSCI